MNQEPEDEGRVEFLLEERARRLARPPKKRGERGDLLHFLAFSLGPETLAADLSDILEARPLPELTPVPGAPGYVLGLVNLRGAIHPVVDLAPLLGLPARDLSAEPHIVRAPVAADKAGEGASLCFVTDGRPWSMTAEKSALSPAPDSMAEAARPFVRGSLPGPVLILDLIRLLSDNRLVVDQE